MAARGDALEVLATDAGTLVAAWKNVFLQVRRGPLVESTFDRIVAAMKRYRVRIPRDVPIGVLAIIEDGAPIPDELVRTKQRAVVSEVLKDPRYSTLNARSLHINDMYSMVEALAPTRTTASSTRSSRTP